MKTIIAVFLVLNSFALCAQVTVPKGNALLGGCVGYKSKTTEVNIPNQDDNKESWYNIEASALFGINDNWYVGGGLGYEGEKETTTNTEDKNSLFTIGPIVRYQYGFTERAACFLNLGLSYGSGMFENSTTSIDPVTLLPVTNTFTDKFSRISAQISPGISWRVKPRWALNFQFGGLGYTSTTYKPDDIIPGAEDYTESKFRLHVNTDHIRLGAHYVIGGSY